MTTPDWPAFLAARLNEQLPGIEALRGHPWQVWKTLGEQVLADIAAKRAILKRYRLLILEADKYRHDMGPVGRAIFAQLEAHLEDIKDLCRPFADHDDWPGER